MNDQGRFRSLSGPEARVTLLAPNAAKDAGGAGPPRTSDRSEPGAPPGGAIPAEDRFQKIFDHTNDGIFVIDPEHDAILDANGRACRMLGYTREELLAARPTQIHAHEGERFTRFSQEVLERGSGFTADLSCRHKSGGLVPVEMSASVIEVGGGRRLLGLVRDVSEQRQMQKRLEEHASLLEGLVEEQTERLRRAEERQRVLLQVNNAIVTHLDRESLFVAISEVLREVVPFDRSTLVLDDPVRGCLVVTALWQPSVPIRPLPVGTEWPREGSIIGHVLKLKKALRVDDWRAETRFVEKTRLLEVGVLSSIATPMLVRGEAIGSLNVGSREVARYRDEDAGLLLAVAEQVGLAVANLLAYEEIARLKTRVELENRYLREEARSERGLADILGESVAIRRVRDAVATVGPTDSTVLITGETGTGKELVARALHDISPRRAKALVRVNCAALPAGLIESELFGHEKGAFTGAVVRKIGRFELADGGSIFLDEIGDLPLELQSKLLRVLQEGEFERVGGSATLKVRVRVIAATNLDLEAAIESGKFRPDLFYRLNVFPVAVPALRERPEDVPILVRHLVLRNATRLGKRIDDVPPTVMEALAGYTWPGNVRELENVIERAVILSRSPTLSLEGCLPAPKAAGPAGTSIATLRDLEKKHISEVLTLTRGRVSGERGAARILGLKPTTLEARMKRLGIEKLPR